MRRSLAHGIADFSHRVAVRNLHAAQVAQAHAIEVRMGVEKARYYGTALEVDHAGVRPACFKECSARTRSNHTSARDRQGFHRAAFRIQRVDSPVVQDQVWNNLGLRHSEPL